ncbi:FAD-binding oxidoreductase [Sulfobacillus thermosulfidooxidans]|uniref:FAD-binding oxidoreductase n=1 Tax=Sulfobacillus thermosulfidooxidans TaxID=28034 RepID=UPI00096BB0A7|nr:FAD-binding oxidoreductase [Sulfobacillus thermosulfidooxidans]
MLKRGQIMLVSLSTVPHQPINNQILGPDAQKKEECLCALTQRFGDRIIRDADRLLAYSYDATSQRHRPDAAFIAESEEELRYVLQIASQYGMPVIARGSGSNISGGTLPISGGIVVSLTHFKRIKSIDVRARQTRVEPGVVNARLQEALEPYGFFFPPDPASHRISTLGGNVSEGSGGPHCVKYGTTSHYVTGIKALLADGTPITCQESLSIIDWPGLLTGSEGILAIITEITLRILPKTPSTGTLLAGFQSVIDAVSAVSGIVRAQMIPSTLELLDKATLDTVRPFMDAGYPHSDAVLLIEVDGSPLSVQAQLQHLVNVLQQYHADPVIIAENPEHAHQLMAARRSAYGAAARLASHVWTQDVTVPRPLLAEMMSHVLTISRRYALAINTVAHAGDGNLHPLIPYHPDDADEVERMRKADHAILQKAAELGGSITGEHGIGIDKLHELPLMYSPDELAAMYAIKMAFDPENILNPGKAVYPVQNTSYTYDAGPGQALNSIIQPRSVDELRDTVRQAYVQKIHLTLDKHGVHKDACRVNLSHLQDILDFDPDNMTITVQAGLSYIALQSFLDQYRLMFPVIPLQKDQTLGSLVAEGLPHLAHLGYGPLKNWILGLSVIDGTGRQLQFGRKIMKNVAGLDMPKLFIGSLGQFGMITTLILRLLPKFPEQVIYTLDHQHINSEQYESLIHAFITTAPGPQGLWTMGNHLTIYVDGHDLPSQHQYIEQICDRGGISYQRHDALDILALTQSKLDTLFDQARRQHSGYVFGVGPLPRSITTAFHALDDSLWIVPEASDNGVQQLQQNGCRVLNHNGWQVINLADSSLTKITERLKQYFDPQNVFGHP